MSFDTFAQLLPKNIVYAAKWILLKLIIDPFVAWNTGATMYVFSNDTYLSAIVRHFTGNTTVALDSGVKAYFSAFYWQYG